MIQNKRMRMLEVPYFNKKAMVKECLVTQPLMQARSMGGKAQGMLEEQVYDTVWVCHPFRQ
jgi:hypothetical protein